MSIPRIASSTGNSRPDRARPRRTPRYRSFRCGVTSLSVSHSKARAASGTTPGPGSATKGTTLPSGGRRSCSWAPAAARTPSGTYSSGVDQSRPRGDNDVVSIHRAGAGGGIYSPRRRSCWTSTALSRGVWARSSSCASESGGSATQAIPPPLGQTFTG